MHDALIGAAELEAATALARAQERDVDGVLLAVLLPRGVSVDELLADENVFTGPRIPALGVSERGVVDCGSSVRNIRRLGEALAHRTSPR